jgi:hypothetical protein
MRTRIRRWLCCARPAAPAPDACDCALAARCRGVSTRTTSRRRPVADRRRLGLRHSRGLHRRSEEGHVLEFHGPGQRRIPHVGSCTRRPGRGDARTVYPVSSIRTFRGPELKREETAGAKAETALPGESGGWGIQAALSLDARVWRLRHGSLRGPAASHRTISIPRISGTINSVERRVHSEAR